MTSHGSELSLLNFPHPQPQSLYYGLPSHWKLSESYDLERQRKPKSWLSPNESRAMNLLGSITSLIKHSIEPPKDWDKWILMCGEEGRCSFPRDSLEQWYPSLCIKYSGEYLKGTPPVIHLHCRILTTLPSPLPSPGITQLGAQDWGRGNIHRTVQAYLDVIWRVKEMAWEKVWKHSNIVDWPRKAKRKDIRRVHVKCLLKALKIVIFNPEILLLRSFPRKHVQKDYIKGCSLQHNSITVRKLEGKKLWSNNIMQIKWTMVQPYGGMQCSHSKLWLLRVLKTWENICNV